ncbi:MAG: hypothetical protein H0X38_08605 [Planctomycetes bacterium]|nr:hypothetical protein [Planctomycetota bacterium]
MRPILVFALALLALALTGAEDPRPAGQAELDRLDHEIAVVEGLLATADQGLERNHATTLAMLDQTMRAGIAGWTDWHPPLATPSTPQDMQTWYLRGLQERHGFDVREPATPWQHQWRRL